MTNPHDTLNLPQNLGNGLVLRSATPADTEPLAEFNTKVHLEDGEPANFLTDWTRTLMSEKHPTMKPEDFILVEDTNHSKIVSATCLIPQVWHYDGIPIQVGRPELVGTDPDYRRRGLVRAIFETIHQLSAAYGHQVQGITGIPWYYRQFGYEYALNLGGFRSLALANVPELKDDESEPYQIRPATTADIPTLMQLYQGYGGGPITVPADEVRWRYEIIDRSYFSREMCITDLQGKVVGAYAHSADVWKNNLALWTLALEKTISMRIVLPIVIRALKAYGQAKLAEQENGADKKLEAIHLNMGAEHPAYEAFETKLTPLRPPYGWYLRVPNLPGFIQHLSPALEKRLAGSVMTGYSGELKLNFYQNGLKLVFENGQLITTEAWHSTNNQQDNGDAAFPPQVFLKLLFGYRSLEELRFAYPDCWANEEPTLLLNALFPKQASWVIALS